MKVALAQINTTVGALKENTDKAIQYIDKAGDDGADIVLLPETTIPGYMTLDLLFNDKFISDNLKELDRLISECQNIVVIVGFVEKLDNSLYNTAGVIQDGKLLGKVHKIRLPTYDVFDEDRYYTSGVNSDPVKVKIEGKTVNLGIQICEDMWDRSAKNVTTVLASNNSDILLNISASPYAEGKISERIRLITGHSKNTGKPFFYCNLVGGQDEVVFDGTSLASDTKGNLIHKSDSFKEELSIINLEDKKSISFDKETDLNGDNIEDSFNAITLGIHDYIKKSGFNSALVGLSGGVDSSLVAVLACEALGPENVTGVSMPSRYSSEHGKKDAEELAKSLGMNFKNISIEKMYSTYLEALSKHFRNTDQNESEENIQARIRGNILMALSNKFGHMLLSTGNKTELALGYATMYGDMAGGLSPINDVSKLQVYKMCEYYNRKNNNAIIPESVLSKKPSAELSENQFDPFDYEVVSPLVEDIIEHGKSVKDLVNAGYAVEDVERIHNLIKNSEYKRRQAPPGIKITKRAFGIGRRMPLINHYRAELYD